MHTLQYQITVKIRDVPRVSSPQLVVFYEMIFSEHTSKPGVLMMVEFLKTSGHVHEGRFLNVYTIRSEPRSW